MKDIRNVIVVPSSDRFFRYWFEFLKPLHQLTDRETDVLAAMAQHRYNLSKVISDPVLLDNVAFNEDGRKKIREECNLTQAYFQVIMTKFRKNKVFIGNKINPKYLPKFNDDDKTVNLLLSFNL